MVYLHENDVLVRDLKPANIGFDRWGNVKLFDFGLARELHECDDLGFAGSLRYQAPESVLSTSIVTLASDVYSFGVLLWEICTLKKPFGSKYSTIDAFQENVDQKDERPSLGSIPSRLIQDLIRKCWDPCPTNRPNFAQVQEVLETKLAPRPKACYSHLLLLSSSSARSVLLAYGTPGPLKEESSIAVRLRKHRQELGISSHSCTDTTTQHSDSVFQPLDESVLSTGAILSPRNLVSDPS